MQDVIVDDAAELDPRQGSKGIVLQSTKMNSFSLLFAFTKLLSLAVPVLWEVEFGKDLMTM